MNNEIKEILDYLKDEDEYYKKAEEIIVGYGDLIVEKEDVDKLLDYITNLQEEKENQAHTIKTLLKENGRLKINIARALDYIRMHCEIRRNEKEEYDEIGKVEAMPIYYILQGEDKE